MKFFESESSEYVSLSVGKTEVESSQNKMKYMACGAILASLVIVGGLTVRGVMPAHSSFAIQTDMMMDKIYYKLDHTATSTTEALALCTSTGGQLSRIDNERDLKAATKECAKVEACYIGLIRNPQSGVFMWFDGNPLVFNKWLDGQQPGSSTPCVQLAGQGQQNEGQWSGIECSGSTRNILCMRRPKQFFKVPGEVNSQAEYAVMCRSSGGQMAVILNAAENRRAWSACGSDGNGCWLGAGRDPVSYAFMWLNGEGVCYENWSANGPSGEGGSCAMIDTNGDWVDVPCSGQPIGILCQSQ